MKKNRFILDVETTGFDKVRDQITELAIIVEDSNCKVIDSLDLKIKLMPNSIPSPSALLVTKINPFSKEWEKEGITPYEAALAIKKLAEKHSGTGAKLIFTAYNAFFDKDRVEQLLNVCLFKFEDLFDKSIFDPLNTSKILIEQGKLATKTKERKNGGTYQSATLGDVAVALGIITEEKLATLHRAMEDTELLRNVIHKLFVLATGEEMIALESNPKEYKKGELISAITDLHEQGLKKHTLLVDSNNPDEEKIVAVDLDHWREYHLEEAAVKVFNYGDFLSSKKITTEKEIKDSDKFYIRNRSKIHMLINLAKNKNEEEIQVEKTYKFDLIEKVEKIMAGAKDKDSAKKLKSQALELLKDEEKPQEILSLAEQLHIYKGNNGWSPLLGEKLPHMEDDDAAYVEVEIKKTPVKVVMNPSGFYEIHANGKSVKATTKGDIGPMIASIVEGAPKGGKSIKDLEKKLLLIKEFKNDKHPLALKQELTDILSEDKDFSEEEQTILNDLLDYYKKKYPNTFKDYTLNFEKEVYENLSSLEANISIPLPLPLDLFQKPEEKTQNNKPSLEERKAQLNMNFIENSLNFLFYSIDLNTGEVFSKFANFDIKKIDTIEVLKDGVLINDIKFNLVEENSSEKILSSKDHPFLIKESLTEEIEVVDYITDLESLIDEPYFSSPQENSGQIVEIINLTDTFSSSLKKSSNRENAWKNLENSIFKGSTNAKSFLKKK